MGQSRRITFAAPALLTALGFAAPFRTEQSLTTVPQRDAARSHGDAPAAVVSRGGDHVAFASYAQLVPADADPSLDIYVLDRRSGHVTLESVGGGHAADVDCLFPGISDDGRFLVYQTVAATRDSAAAIVVRRDRDAGTDIVISGGAVSAWSGAPVISGNGRFVAFVSAATDLTPDGDANRESDDVYVFDAATRVIERASVDTRGVHPATGASIAPAISSDGRYVAFASTAPLQGASKPAKEATRRLAQVYVRDRIRRTTVLVSAASGGGAGDAPSWRPAIDGAGRHIAFVSTARNLAPDDRDAGADVMLADLETGAISLISRSARGGPGNGPSAKPVLSADGMLVAFQSDASDLLCGRVCNAAAEDFNLLSDVFLFDRRTRAMSRISGGHAGGWLEPSVDPAISASGSVVAFSSRHPIDAADTRNDFDLFIRSAAPPSDRHAPPARREDMRPRPLLLRAARSLPPSPGDRSR